MSPLSADPQPVSWILLPFCSALFISCYVVVFRCSEVVLQLVVGTSSYQERIMKVLLSGSSMFAFFFRASGWRLLFCPGAAARIVGGVVSSKHQQALTPRCVGRTPGPASLASFLYVVVPPRGGGVAASAPAARRRRLRPGCQRGGGDGAGRGPSRRLLLVLLVGCCAPAAAGRAAGATRSLARRAAARAGGVLGKRWMSPA